MVWYNPLTWFQSGPVRKPGVLYCDSPQCGQPIRDNEMSYHSGLGKLYHPGDPQFDDCRLFAVAAMTLATGIPMYALFESITRKEALELLKTGKLAQSGGLEQKL